MNAITTDPTNPVPVLSHDDTLRMLKLIKGSDSVELKLIVPLTEQHATIKALGLDPIEAEPRQAFFFDTADLALNRAGLIVRARRIRGGLGDTVVKLRPVDPDTIDADLRRSASFKIEVDALPGGFVCSASCKGTCTAQEVLDAATGKMPLKSLFSKEQRGFYDRHAPAGIQWNSLLTLGPAFLLKSKHQPKNFDRRITVEMWFYPDGSRLLEISTKCLPAESFQVAAEFKSFLVECGIGIIAGQATKTKAAMDFFKRKVAAERSAGGLAPG
ncbi:MAG: adenylate cyclase [Verrucomicrobia bacterium]|nr:adenylate cyclase [Verrucomicrobiota bacterium]